MTSGCLFSGFGGKAQRRCQECGESQSDVMPVSSFVAFSLHLKALNFQRVSSGIAHLCRAPFVPDTDMTCVHMRQLSFRFVFQ